MKREDELAREFLHSVLAGMKAGLFAIDQDARITNFTPRAETLTGFSQNEALGGRCYEVLRTVQCEECPVRRTHRVPEETVNYETIATSKSGAQLPVDVTLSPLRSNGQTIGAVGIVRDMTERKRLWENLRQERDRVRQYLNIARVTIVALDSRGKVTLVNKRGCELLGYEEDEILGRDWFDLCIPEAGREDTRRIFLTAMAGSMESEICEEIPVVTKDGSERIIAWHHVTLKDENGGFTGLLSSGEDVTDSKRAQAELIRSERLAAIGQLAAGVAHEVNNPLAGILVYLKVLLKKYRDGTLQSEETEKQLLKMERETARSSRIIKDLLDFSRQSEPSLRPIHVNEVVEATLAIIGHQISLGNVILEKKLTDELPLVVADFDQIQQALMNVVLNAIQAMPEGGKLTIATSLAKGVEIDGSIRNAVEIAISDTGTGIPEESLDHVFTPFFSTKPKGGGVGLGLSAVQGIIERHRGRIEVNSKLKVGTTFMIWLEAMNEEQHQDPGRRR